MCICLFARIDYTKGGFPPNSNYDAKIVDGSLRCFWWSRQFPFTNGNPRSKYLQHTDADLTQICTLILTPFTGLRSLYKTEEKTVPSLYQLKFALLYDILPSTTLSSHNVFISRSFFLQMVVNIDTVLHTRFNALTHWIYYSLAINHRNVLDVVFTLSTFLGVTGCSSVPV